MCGRGDEQATSSESVAASERSCLHASGVGLPLGGTALHSHNGLCYDAPVATSSADALRDDSDASDTSTVVLLRPGFPGIVAFSARLP
jgi:hypothetical protein